MTLKKIRNLLKKWLEKVLYGGQSDDSIKSTYPPFHA